MRIILSRTDSIGDVVLTLPMAAALKQANPGCTIIFLGREYTRPVVELCRNVDEFVVWGTPPGSPEKSGKEFSGQDLLAGLKADVIIHVFPVREICVAAKKAGIPLRIATSRRFFTWFTCNKLLHIPRKNSDLHESQLNLKMLKGLGIDREFTLEEIGGMYGVKCEMRSVKSEVRNVKCEVVVMHPRSKGSAREWGVENFSRLIEILPRDKFQILITGTKEEGLMMKDFLERHKERVVDMTGKLSLHDFIELIGSADALVAASTGPLHIAAALGNPRDRAIRTDAADFPETLGAGGPKATFLVLEKNCNDCRKTMDCACIRSITPEMVAERLEALA